MIELAPFEREAAGSFVPALAAIGVAARRRGWQPEVVLSEGARHHPWIADLEASEMSVHFAPSQGRRGRVDWLRDLLDRYGGPTVMHAHFTTWDIAVALLASPGEGRHSYWHVHTILSRGPIAFLRNLAKFAPLARRLDGVLCPVANTGSELRSRGVPAGRIHVVPNGIDPDRYPLQDEASRRRARDHLGIPADAQVALHFGWDWGIKGGDLFLDAVARLVGDGHEGIVALAQAGGERAVDKARRCGIEKHVHPVGTFDDVTELFAAADVFLALSAREGVNYAVLEAICTGTPVVASDIPGHRVVADACPGYRVVPRTAESVADAVRELLARPAEIRAAEGAAGREWVSRNLSASETATRILDIFESDLGRGPAT